MRYCTQELQIVLMIQITCICVDIQRKGKYDIQYVQFPKYHISHLYKKRGKDSATMLSNK